MKKKKQIIIIGLSLIAIILVTLSATYARYISNSLWDYYLQSKGFYFNSDNLAMNSATNLNDNWQGESIYFNVRNNQSESVITDYDISYTVTCNVTGSASSYTECQLNGTPSNTATGTLSAVEACVNDTGDNIDVSAYNKTACELGGYEWKHQIAQANHYFDIVLTDANYQITDVNVSIVVKSTAPYSKTLSGDFILYKGASLNDDITLSYKHFYNYDRLIISNSYNVDKCIKVLWDADVLLIDEDLNSFEGFDTDNNGYVNEVIFTIKAKSTQSFVFYGRDLNGVYDESEFEWSDSNVCT